MSVILITDHNENIYNVVQKVEARYKKSPRFIPKVRKRIEKQLQEESSGRKPYGVMGLPEQPLPDPSKYLRSREGLKQLKKSASSDQHNGGKGQLKNPLPTEEELREFRKKWKRPEERNFINVNVKAVVHQKPKNPTKQLVLDCFGNKKELNRGLEPRYIYTKTFGKTPGYLKKQMRKWETQAQRLKDFSGIDQPICRYITREERDELLEVSKRRTLLPHSFIKSVLLIDSKNNNP